MPGCDLIIRRPVGQPPIPRDAWLRLAVSSPALVLLTAPWEGAPDAGEGSPSFRLSGSRGRTTLAWRDGQVVVRSVVDEDLADLFAVAQRLDAELVRLDGTPPAPAN